MLFYDLKKGELRRGLAHEEFISSDAKRELTRGHTLNGEKLDKLLAAGKESLEKYSKKILEGDFTPAPSSESCRFCEAHTFCRAGIEYV
jgi:ATP-dependent helicase/DNAse subunit B